MWLRHGGLDQLSTLGGQLTAIGQLTALFGTYLALVQLVLMSRSPWLDQVFGMDGLAVAHRWLGFATVWLLLGHGVFTTVGYALGDRSGVVDEFVTLITTYPYVLMALVSGVLFAAVAISSMRAARRRLSYETWYGIHLYAYLAIALGFLHQLFVGTDFMHDPLAVAYWIVLYVVTIALILVFRVGQPVVAVRRGIGCACRASSTKAPDVVSIYMTGRDLDQLAVRSGQYFVWRFLTRDGWWRGHPFSISSAPNGRWLRITIKELGDWSGSLARVPVGTRVFVEGPVWRPDRRPPDAAQGPARRGRDRDHAAARPARGAARQAGRPDPRLPRRGRDADRLPRRARDARPSSRSDASTTSSARARPEGARSARRGRPRAARAGCRATATSTCADPVAMMQRGRGEPARPGLSRGQIHAERFAY